MSTRIFLLATFLTWIWSRWNVDYNKYDLLAAESEKYICAVFGNSSTPIENAPESWLPQLYPSLNPNIDGLRALRVAPASSGPIICRTASFTFSQQPRYRALSYEWGPPTSHCPSYSMVLSCTRGRTSGMPFTTYDIPMRKSACGQMCSVSISKVTLRKQGLYHR